VNRESPAVRRVKHALVAGQIALALVALVALVVLAGAGLLVRSFLRLQQQPLGFPVDDAMVAELPLLGALYRDPSQRLDFYDRLIARLDATPGVTAATATIITPFAGDGGWTGTITVEGQGEADAALNPAMNLDAMLPNYFRTMALPLRSGRTFTDADREGSVPVAIVSEALAEKAWPRSDPIGRRLKLGAPRSPAPWVTVVGVAGETRYRSLTRPMPTIYRPLKQWTPRPHFLIVRGMGGVDALAAILRDAVHELEPAERVFDVTSMSRLVAQQFVRPRISTVVLCAYAVIALLLASIGLYGSMAALVAQRTKEMGIRRALGAQRWDIGRLVLGSAMALVLAGIIAGSVSAIAGSRLVESLLYGVSPADPVALSVAVMVLIATAALACAVPVWSASVVDPIVALRGD
jgi:predicted permease